jgi:hypothetical protein
MKPVRLRFGERITPAAPKPSNDPTTTHGAGWLLRRTSTGATLTYLTGHFGTRERRIDLGASDYARLRADPAAIEALIRDHDR